MEELVKSIGVPAVIVLLILREVREMLGAKKKPNGSEEVHRHYEEVAMARIEKKLDQLVARKP